MIFFESCQFFWVSSFMEILDGSGMSLPLIDSFWLSKGMGTFHGITPEGQNTKLPVNASSRRQGQDTVALVTQHLGRKGPREQHAGLLAADTRKVRERSDGTIVNLLCNMGPQ